MHSLNVITQSGCYDEAAGCNEVSPSSLIGILPLDGVSDDIPEREIAKFDVWITPQNYSSCFFPPSTQPLYNLFICVTKIKESTALDFNPVILLINTWAE